jgi:hypothetical protein
MAGHLLSLARQRRPSHVVGRLSLAGLRVSGGRNRGWELSGQARSWALRVRGGPDLAG